MKNNKKACPAASGEPRLWREQGRRVFVAMSGGVDSSVAALLLKKQKYDVVGVFMKFWMDTDSRRLNENKCCSLEARQDAMAVCAKLKIPFLTWDFQKEFKRTVVDDFICGYKKGITPNPCVICNKEIKLGLFLKKALKMGADYVATGHYIRIKNYVFAHSKSPEGLLRIKNNKNPLFIIHHSLFTARDAQKDQSYFLWTLTQKQLKHCLFPIGDYLKRDVRQIAKKANLPVAFKKESQEVCFVKDKDLYGFLKTRIHTDKGEIIELKTGKKLAEHNGVEFYTIGQRVPVGGIGPYYVGNKNIKKNQLLVVQKNDKNFFRKEIILKNVNWVSGQPPRLRPAYAKATAGKQGFGGQAKSAKILVRTRYRQPLIRASFIIHNSLFKLVFDQPVKFVAPGQSAVFYNKQGPSYAKASAGKELLGGGIIV